MYNVQVSKVMPQTKFEGEQALDIPVGRIVIATVNKGIVKGASGQLMRTDCDAHPFVELQTGKLWSEDLEPFTFEFIPNAVQIVITLAKYPEF